MIRLTKPEIEGAIGAIGSVLKDGFLVQGEKVRRFEAMVSAYVGRKHGVAVNSGTSAIQCALMAIGVGDGDEVIVPDFTFPATANAVVSCGATPVLADIDIATFNLCLESVEGSLSPKTKAIMPVDLFGLAAQMESISELARRLGLLVVEDSACALGSTFGGRKCGSFGDASVVSFHPRKIVTTGEGGMVLADSGTYADTVRKLRNHGINARGGKTEFVLAGYNLRMNEIEACLGIAQMSDIENLIERRRRVARLYDSLLGEIAEIKTPIEPEGCFHTYQSYVVLVDTGIDRDGLIAFMRAGGVETAIGTYAIHLEPFYRNKFGYEPGSLPASSNAFKHSLALPIYPSMEEETVAEVVSVLKRCLHAAPAGS